MIVEFLEITFSRHDTCKLLCDTSLALARSSPTRRYTGTLRIHVDVDVCGLWIHIPTHVLYVDQPNMVYVIFIKTLKSIVPQRLFSNYHKKSGYRYKI